MNEKMNALQLILIAVALLPSIIAQRRHHANEMAIAALNFIAIVVSAIGVIFPLIFAVTAIAWCIAFVWAFTSGGGGGGRIRITR